MLARLTKSRKLPKQRQQHHYIFNLVGGLNTDMPSTLIAENELTHCKDILCREGVISKGYGNAVFADTDENPLDGTFMAANRYIKTNESEKLVLHTTDDIYYYDTDDDTFISILGDEELTGDEDDFFTWTIVNDYYVFSNGIAPIYYWNMSDASISQMIGATSKAARKMLVFGERLCLYGLPNAFRRVAWTIVGGVSIPPVATDWTNTGAGDADLDSVLENDVIITAEKMGQNIIIYGKHSIVLQEYTGKVNSPFSFYTLISNTGTPSRRGVVSVGSSHIVLGQDDVYLYSGGRTVDSLMEGKVRKALFTDINPAYIHRAFLKYVARTNEVCIYYPPIGQTLPTSYFRYNITNKSWVRGERSYTGCGEYKRSDSATWGDESDGTTWDEDEGRWDDSNVEESAAIDLFGDSTGEVFIEDESTRDICGVAQSSFFDTKDFTSSSHYREMVVNWMEVMFEALGSTVSVYYSTDLGYSWKLLKTVTLSSFWTKYTLNCNVNATQIRFRFFNGDEGGSMEVRPIGVGFIDASDRGKNE